MKQLDNCSTIIIGKNATTTGKVLVAHGEDDPASFTQLHMVPRVTHKEGEYLIFDDCPEVRIPEVPETCAYYWSEVRCPGGESFADGFLNEHGVLVVSNSCVEAKTTDADPQPKGIGAGLRRLIAERCTTAREGVQVAADLLKTYGYRSSRCYTIADKDEAWMFQATTGPNYVAQKVGDDEIAYIPNWYTIHEVDLKDTEHKKFYFSETLVDYPLRNGWYKPAKEGDYSDFDFTEAYMTPSCLVASNTERSDIAWTALTGEPKPYRTFSVKADRKYAPADLKKILRTHYTGWEEDLKKDPKMSPHRYGICRDTTRESLVMEFNEVNELNCMWRAHLRPCTNPFVPFYQGMLTIPEGYEWMSFKASQRSHLTPDDSDFTYHPERASSAFFMLMNIMEFDYAYAAPVIHGEIAEMEKEWDVTKPQMDKVFLALKDLNYRYARDMLNDYTAAAAEKSFKWAQDAAFRLVKMKDRANMDYWRREVYHLY